MRPKQPQSEPHDDLLRARLQNLVDALHRDLCADVFGRAEPMLLR
jgi:hypothetical protein